MEKLTKLKKNSAKGLLVVFSFVFLVSCILKKHEINKVGNSSLKANNSDSLARLCFPYTLAEFDAHLESYLQTISFDRSKLKSRVVSYVLLINPNTGAVKKNVSVFSEWPGEEFEKVLGEFMLILKKFRKEHINQNSKDGFKCTISLIFNEFGKLLDLRFNGNKVE